jgi:hypothetical protein
MFFRQGFHHRVIPSGFWQQAVTGLRFRDVRALTSLHPGLD